MQPLKPAPADEYLMEEVCRGRRAAFEMLYDRYQPRLLRFARGYFPDPAQAEDAVQEVFIRIMEQPQKFDASRRFSTWVFSVTANTCKNLLRGRDSRLRAEGQAEMAGDGDWQEQEDLEQRVRELLEELSEKERQIYALRYEEDMSIREIAEVLRIPEGSVKSGMYYLLKKMNVWLKTENHEKY